MQWQGLAARTITLWAALAPFTGRAQAVAPPTSTEQALHNLSARAAVVFVGSVAGIRRIAGDGQSSGVVEITFSVDQAVRGAAAGGAYTVREWAGLWMANDQRYRVGQRLLMLLNAPGPSGLSTPVSGMDGAIPVLGAAPAVHPGSTASAPATAAVADLRWIAAGVVRPVPSPSAPTAHGNPLHGIARAQAAPAPEAPPTQQTPLSTVLTQLTAWSLSDAR